MRAAPSYSFTLYRSAGQRRKRRLAVLLLAGFGTACLVTASGAASFAAGAHGATAPAADPPPADGHTVVYVDSQDCTGLHGVLLNNQEDLGNPVQVTVYQSNGSTIVGSTPVLFTTANTTVNGTVTTTPFTIPVTSAVPAATDYVWGLSDTGYTGPATPPDEGPLTIPASTCAVTTTTPPVTTTTTSQPPTTTTTPPVSTSSTPPVSTTSSAPVTTSPTVQPTQTSVAPTVAPTTTATPVAATPQLTLSVSTVAPGGVLTVAGTGYVPGEDVRLTLHSTVVGLGTVKANSNGGFSVRVRIPGTTAIGAHEISGLGQTSGRTASASLTVADTADATLPFTGAPITSTALLGFSVLMLGAVLYLVGAKRGRHQAR